MRLIIFKNNCDFLQSLLNINDFLAVTWCYISVLLTIFTS